MMSAAQALPQNCLGMVLAFFPSPWPIRIMGRVGEEGFEGPIQVKSPLRYVLFRYGIEKTINVIRFVSDHNRVLLLSISIDLPIALAEIDQGCPTLLLAVA